MNASKIIAVTGGNRGIGLEMCRQLAELGHRVILCSRDLDKGLEAVRVLQVGGLRGELEARQLDMADETSIRGCVADLAKDYGVLDVLINNAGIISSTKGALTVTMEEMRRVFEPNYWGPFLLSQLCVPLLRKSSSGRIINVSSQMGALDSLQGGYAAYRLSKAALNAMTILMANELRGEGIFVNGMCPGWVRTDMGGAGATRSVSQGADTAVWLATAGNIPTGKFFSDRREQVW